MMYEIPSEPFDIEAELSRARRFYREQAIPPDKLALMDRSTADLVQSGALAKALTVGDTAPDFSLPDALGRTIVLSKLLAERAVVLTFYRGQWCPYCQLTLRDLQNHLDEFDRHNGRLVAVSPQLPDNSIDTAEKLGLKFDVLSDEGAVVARSYGIAFDVQSYLSAAYAEFGHPLPAFNGSGNEVLPVPATFVVDRSRIIRYAFVDPDYTYRANPRDIAMALDSLT